MQYNDSDVEKVRVVSIQQQIRVFASMFLDQAHKGHYGRALATSVGTKIFGKDHQLEPYYVSDYAYYKLESFFRRRVLDPKYKPARYHLLLLARLISSKGALPATRANEMKRYCEDVLGEFYWDDSKALSLFQQAASVLDRALRGRQTERSLTKTEAFTAEILAAAASK